MLSHSLIPGLTFTPRHHGSFVHSNDPRRSLSLHTPPCNRISPHASQLPYHSAHLPFVLYSTLFLQHPTCFPRPPTFFILLLTASDQLLPLPISSYRCPSLPTAVHNSPPFPITIYLPCTLFLFLSVPMRMSLPIDSHLAYHRSAKQIAFSHYRLLPITSNTPRRQPSPHFHAYANPSTSYHFSPLQFSSPLPILIPPLLLHLDRYLSIRTDFLGLPISPYSFLCCFLTVLNSSSHSPPCSLSLASTTPFIPLQTLSMVTSFRFSHRPLSPPASSF